ncbi:MAG TPA: BamA/TamA family outer membrane protein [Bacteroidia bacterium]|nr:BamA/TamA family outer membrane protein [Bacteroidia bacterium]
MLFLKLKRDRMSVIRFSYPLLILLLHLPAFCKGQDSLGALAGKRGKEKNFRFIPLPAIAATPTTGWMLGVAPGAYWTMGPPENTSPSSALGTIIFTQKHQVLITAKANTFFRADAWNMLSDLRYFINAQPTYGLGTGPQSAKPVGQGGINFSDNPYEPIPSAQMMDFRYLRIHNTIMKRHGNSRYFYGLGYHLDYHYNIDDKLLNLDTVPAVITSHYGYSVYHGFDPKSYCLSGVSFNLLFDSRDNAVNPYKGRYAYANIRLNPIWMGSTKQSGLLWLEYRDYLHLSKDRPRHLIGWWTYGWFQTYGTAPYMDLPGVGWDQFGRSGRAYTQGRFRGQDLVYSELEYRVPLQKNKETFGAVAFLNGTTASNRDAGIQLFQYVDLAYGIGLRVMVMKKSRANLSIDYAWGRYGAQGFYFGLNEVF